MRSTVRAEIFPLCADVSKKKFKLFNKTIVVNCEEKTEKEQEEILVAVIAE